MENKQGNILGTQPIGQLLLKFAVPSIIAMQVSALYNIVDQIFIGHSVGVLGNAATNVAFPLSTVCVALCLLFGVGGAANFNLCMGAGDKERARHFVGNAVALLLLSGILLSLFSFILLEPMMRFFGATPDVLGYALEYTGITLWGFPFLIIANGGANLVRADGSPKYSMMCMLVGAIINRTGCFWFDGNCILKPYENGEAFVERSETVRKKSGSDHIAWSGRML